MTGARFERMRGTTMVEFAIVCALLLLLVIGGIEIGRAFYLWNTAVEATRRAARLAAVCPIGNSAVIKAALLNGPDGSNTSSALHGLTDAQITVTYLNSADMPTTNYPDVQYVRVSITGYQVTLFIPFYTTTITVPSFSTTLPAESLGYTSETSRQCFGEGT